MGLFVKPHSSEGTILAQNKIVPLDKYGKYNNNVVLVGASGRGKTRHFIKPNVMQMNCNYVISDPKGNLILELGSLLEKEGYEIKVLNLIDLAHSNTYNPFRYVQCQADVYKLIDYLLLNLNPDFGHGSQNFWDKSSMALLSAVCFLLFESFSQEECTFANVMMLLRAHEIRGISDDFQSTLDILFEQLEEKNPYSIAVKQYKVFKSAAAPETASSIMVTTEVYLQNFNLFEYENITGTDNIHLEELSKKKTALFVITSDTDSSKNWLAGIFYSQLFDILCNQENKYHIRFIMDDFVCTGRIPDFDKKMAMVRSRNISCMIVLQDEAQLEQEYGKAAQGIITNCESYVFLGSPNVDICDKVARRLGDKRITGADIRKMDDDECVVIYGNGGGIFKKYDLKKHPRFPEISDEKGSAKEYPLAAKHEVPIVYKNKPNKEEETAGIKRVFVKDDYFDSYEEKYLCALMDRVQNLCFNVHVQLRDVFKSEETAYSMKLSYMHCDFLVMNEDLHPMFGIEIDGKQHETDSEQLANDMLKNWFFELNHMPLLRFSAAQVREDPYSVIDRIIKRASDMDPRTQYYLTCAVPKYNEKDMKLKSWSQYCNSFKKAR